MNIIEYLLRGYFMKRYAFIAVCLIFTLVMFGCTSSVNTDYLSYQSSAWIIDADFSIGSSRYTGVITLCAVDGESLSNRDMSISYTSPQTLAGITAGREGGHEYLIYGTYNIPANSGEISNMLEICSLFCIENAAYDTSQQLELDGVKYLFVRLSNDYGSYGIYFDNETGLPRKLEAKLSQTQIAIDIKKIDIPSVKTTDTQAN